MYWIVKLVDRQVKVYTSPDAYGYATYEVLMPGESVPLDIEGVRVGLVAVDDMLPPPQPAAGGSEA